MQAPRTLGGTGHDADRYEPDHATGGTHSLGGKYCRHRPLDASDRARAGSRDQGNGTVVPYDESKIAVAITKAFLAVEGGTAAASSRIRELIARNAEQVTATFERRMPSGGTIHIEEIQDR